MAKSLDLVPEPSRLASLLLSCIPAVPIRRASRSRRAIFERPSHSWALSQRGPPARSAGNSDGSTLQHLTGTEDGKIGR